MASSNTKKRNTSASASGNRKASGTGRAGNGRANTNKKRKRKKQNVLLSEILMLVFIGIAILMLLANLSLCGKAGLYLTYTTFGLFGLTGYLIPVLLVISAFVILTNPGSTYKKFKIFMGFLLLLVISAICQMFSPNYYNPAYTGKDYMVSSIKSKNGGGLLGGLLVRLLMPIFSTAGTWIVLILLAIVLMIVITDFSVVDFFKYILEDFGDSYKENREIRELKNEKNRVLREAQLEENRRRNGEKMLKARKDLERIRTDSAKKKTDYEENSKAGADTDVSVAPKAVVKPQSIQKTAASSKSRIPSFLRDDVKDNASEPGTAPVSEPEDSLDEIIARELKKNTSESEDFSLDDVVKVSHTSQMRISDYPDMKPDDKKTTKAVIKDSETEKKPEEEKKQYYDDGFPVRKKIERKEEDTTRVIETAGGKVIVSSSGTGGTKSLENEEKTDDESRDNTTKKEEPEREYVFPPVTLLGKGQNGHRSNIDKELKETARKLQQTLQNFGVKVNITNVSCGPAVTRYELQPEMGVKVSKILSLQDDIKLNLAAPDIRIEAPIPGKAAIGIEVPNKENVSVSMREILESDSFVNNQSKLAFACGKDIGGQVVIGDISKMTHLLIAGATGSGKSVCINTIIMSILYHAKPSEVKLLMIDPKVVELSVYNGIPHLLRPVVTDAKQAASLLSWAVSEMTDRYNRFAETGVRNIQGYNAKLKETYKGREDEMPKLMSQIVIIVDELADLMMVAANEVEDSILHLAQMARAAGMHLILATQRPSVNVITGVIKANIPSRIAFAVSSGVDSRTILDMVGAEKLLGKGDMLYYPSGLQKPIRVQGAFVSDKEVSSVVEFLVNQGKVYGGGYDQKIDLTAVAAMTEAKSALSAELGNNDKDPLFKEAGNLIVASQKASIGSLQRKFRIGFNRAARIMDQLCESGVVGEEVGTKPREVLMNPDEFEAYCEENL